MRTRCARAQLRVHACDAGPRDIGRPVQSDVQLILIKMAGRAARVDIIIPSPGGALSLSPFEGGRGQEVFDGCSWTRKFRCAVTIFYDGFYVP